MADVVTRFKLETTQFDSKLRDASKSLSDISREASKAGKGFSDFTKDSVEAARALGQTESSASNTKDKLKELVAAFNDAAKAYNGLTAEQKNSDFGKAMSESLDQLKVRITDTKNELQNVGNTMKGTSTESSGLSGMLGDLAGKFGVNISQLGTMSVALGAATVATKVAKDAFFSNEEQLDEWGRVVESSESVYRGFLDALNTGDISGYLNRIDTIVSAARQAYDALDELATFNAFNQINVARARQAFLDAQNDYREGTGSKEQVRAAGNAMKGELDQRRDLEKKAYSAEIVRLAKERGANPVDLARVMLGSYGDYRKLKNMPLTGSRTETMTTPYGVPYQRTYTVAANDQERMGAMLRRFNDDELRNLQGLGAQFVNTGFEKGQIDRQIIRIMNGRGGGAGSTGGGGGGSRGGRGGGGTGGGGGHHVETPEEKAAKLVASAEATFAKTIQSNTLRFENGMDNSEEMRKKELAARERLTMAYAEAYNITQNDEYKTAFEDAAKEYRALDDVVKGKREEFEKAMSEMAEMLKSSNPLEDAVKQLTGESMEDYAKRKGFSLDTGDQGGKKPHGWEFGDKAAATLDKWSAPVSQIAGAVEDLGIDVPKGIEKMLATTQAISAILTGISSAVMLISALTAVKSTPVVGAFLANGGIVPHAADGYVVGGTHYSNDVTPIMANAGEVVLSRAQVGNLSSQLQGMGSMQLEAVIEGEDIRLALQNGDRRRGRGEYVTSKSR